MDAARTREIERNFEAFQLRVPALLPSKEGQFALMRHGEVVSVHVDLIEAVTSGQSLFADGMYSLQEVTTKPLDLGFYSHANPSGPIC
ncbi:MAG: hypothetical protein ABI024_10280 [Vicinamibacterales bacterium]